MKSVNRVQRSLIPVAARSNSIAEKLAGDNPANMKMCKQLTETKSVDQISTISKSESFLNQPPSLHMNNKIPSSSFSKSNLYHRPNSSRRNSAVTQANIEKLDQNGSTISSTKSEIKLYNRNQSKSSIDSNNIESKNFDHNASVSKWRTDFNKERASVDSDCGEEKQCWLNRSSSRETVNQLKAQLPIIAKPKSSSVSSNDGEIKSCISSSLLSSQSSTCSNINVNVEQMELQLKEKEHRLADLLNALAEKEDLIDRLCLEVDDKEHQIAQLISEIKKRKHDMSEMSRKIITLDHELKLVYQERDVSRECAPPTHNTFFAQLSSSPNHSEQQSQLTTAVPSKWLGLIPLSRKFGKLPSKINLKSARKSEQVRELRSILKEKDMIITDLRLETSFTSNRINELLCAIREREEQSAMMQKKQEFLEKAIKSKLLD